MLVSSCRCVYFLELLGGGAVEFVTVGNCWSVKHASSMVLPNVTVTWLYLLLLLLLLLYVSVGSLCYCWPKNACQLLMMRWCIISFIREIMFIRWNRNARKYTYLAANLKNTNFTFLGQEVIPCHRPDKPVTQRFFHSHVLPILQARTLL
jgi:hypothetical protein